MVAGVLTAVGVCGPRFWAITWPCVRDNMLTSWLSEKAKSVKLIYQFIMSDPNID